MSKITQISHEIYDKEVIEFFLKNLKNVTTQSYIKNGLVKKHGQLGQLLWTTINCIRYSWSSSAFSAFKNDYFNIKMHVKFSYSRRMFFNVPLADGALDLKEQNCTVNLKHVLYFFILFHSFVQHPLKWFSFTYVIIKRVKRNVLLLQIESRMLMLPFSFFPS